VEVEYGLFRQPKDLFSRNGKKAITMAKIFLCCMLKGMRSQMTDINRKNIAHHNKASYF
jgi:hypothetical protein